MPGAQVPAQQQLSGAALEALQADGVAHDLDATGLQRGDAGDGHEQPATGDAHHHPRYRRVGGEAQAGDEVLDPPQAVPVLVHQRALDHARKVQDLDGHDRRYSSDALTYRCPQTTGPTTPG
jgi:hypothetical protein